MPVPSANSQSSPPKSFLLVDDDEVFRTRLAKALQTRGLSVHGVGDAGAALDWLKTNHPDAAIVDMRMPGLSGLELVPRLTSRRPGIRIVVLTGYGSIATAVEAVRRGAVNYLTKPLDTDQILAAFDRPVESPDVEAIPSLARVEWEHIQRILHDCDGNISLAARKLGLHRRSLQRKLGKLPPLE